VLPGSVTATRTLPRVVIEPPRTWTRPDLDEIWTHRDLLYLLIRRDLAVRYKQSLIGVFWAVLQPLMLAAVFSVFLGLLAKVPSQSGVPYPLFAMSGLVMWLFVSTAVERASRSTVDNAPLISKVYFPRLIIPVAAVMPGVADFLIGFIVVLLAGMAYGFFPGPSLLAFPGVLLLAVATALGASLWLSALNVKYRDVQLVIPFTIQVALFITPVVYPFDLVPDHLQPLYALNPMVGVLELYRWVLFGEAWPGTLVLIPVVMSVLMIIGGVVYFKRAENSFADLV
jgi:lipopolysaccharide transport system permease protein